MAYYDRFKELANAFYGSKISERSIFQTYFDIILSGAKFGFVFPSDLILEAKALTTAEELVLTLAPDLKFEREAKPIIAREFARRASDMGRLGRLVEQVLPEMLLFGELPPLSTRESSPDRFALQPDWSELFQQVGEQVKAFQPNAAQLRAFVDPSAHSRLIRAYTDFEAGDILDRTWTRYAELATSVPNQETIGARIMVHLSAATVALYQTLLAAGQPPEGAIGLINNIGWDIYRKMGSVSWSIAGTSSHNEYEQLRNATSLFRRFPFSSPSYQWRDVSPRPGVVAFNCLKCPVAEYFRSQNLSDVCVKTWCALDFPLARQWKAELRGTGTIAGGAAVCDFRWLSSVYSSGAAGTNTLRDSE